MESVPIRRIVSAIVPPVYVIVRSPVMPSLQAMTPPDFMDISVPMVVVDSTLAESAPSVDFSAERRAAMGLTRVTLLRPALSPLPELPEESDELQAATPASAVVSAIETVTRRTTVLFIRPTPMRAL